MSSRADRGGLRRGMAWGETVAPPPDLISVGGDAEAATAIAAAAPGAAAPPAGAAAHPPLRLTGGDVLASLGGPSSGPLVNRFTIDVLQVRADGQELVAIAHVVARGRRWWRGPITAVLNVDRLGRWDAAPRAHPGDGRFDLVEVDAAMSPRARWYARRRLPSGTHVPHPQIRTTQRTASTWTFDPARRLWVDGRPRGSVQVLEVTIEPTGAIVYT